MKLSEYLHSKMCCKGKYYLETRTEEQIEEWIVEWYRNSFNEIGCDGTIAQPRVPPSWLAVWKREDIEYFTSLSRRGRNDKTSKF